MEFDLIKACKEKTMVVAHRGSCGGNIPCNSISAYEAALYMGADMIEIDIARSADGVLYVFHPGTEYFFLNSRVQIKDMTSEEVDRLYLINQDRAQTQFKVPRFEEVLERFKGRCYINIDKFWMWPEEIAAMVRAHGMEDQVLIKTDADEEIFDKIEKYAPDMPYMIIATGEDKYTDQLLKRNIRYVGVEALFKTEDDPICSPEYIEEMHKKGLVVWSNAIVYKYTSVLSAGHTDDISVPGDPDAGWGWLARRGFDFIQTDFVMPCIHYLKSIGMR